MSQGVSELNVRPLLMTSRVPGRVGAQRLSIIDDIRQGAGSSGHGRIGLAGTD